MEEGFLRLRLSPGPIADTDPPIPSNPAGVQIRREFACFNVHVDRIITDDTFSRSTYSYFSSDLNKLFANRNTECRVLFKTAIPARFEGQFGIRAHVSFSELVDQSKPVLSCLNNGHIGPLMQCDHGRAVHQQRGIHQTILFPLDYEIDGVLMKEVNFKFVCFSYCPSIKRRRIQLNFALVDLSSNLDVDERTMKLKICEHPGRDIINEERLSV